MILLLEKQLVGAIRADEREARRRAHVSICESKMRFATKSDAKRWCKRSISKGSSPLLRPYKCPVCKLWHTTTRRDW